MAPFRVPVMATKLATGWIKSHWRKHMPQPGRVVFSKMEELVYGRPAAETIADLARRHQAERVFLMVSGALNRETDEIETLRHALGNHCVGTFDRMPPHTPRAAVVAAAEQARNARADLIV